MSLFTRRRKRRRSPLIEWSTSERRQEIKEAENKLAEWQAKHQYPNFVPKDWTDCYKMPLHLDDLIGTYAWTAEDVPALSNFRYMPDNQLTEDWWKGVINIINGEIESTESSVGWTRGKDDPCQIYYNGLYQFTVRGWGHLTGCGYALNLPVEMAREMQDQFINYILNKLNGKG